MCWVFLTQSFCADFMIRASPCSVMARTDCTVPCWGPLDPKLLGVFLAFPTLPSMRTSFGQASSSLSCILFWYHTSVHCMFYSRLSKRRFLTYTPFNLKFKMTCFYFLLFCPNLENFCQTSLCLDVLVTATQKETKTFHKCRQWCT